MSNPRVPLKQTSEGGLKMTTTVTKHYISHKILKIKRFKFRTLYGLLRRSNFETWKVLKECTHWRYGKEDLCGQVISRGTSAAWRLIVITKDAL